MKHIAIDYHFVRDQVSKQLIRVSHVHSRDQLADSLTKPLARQAHQLQQSNIGVLDRLSILRGHESQ